MRTTVDLQACLTDSRYRGIGRFTFNLVEAMYRQAGPEAFHLAVDRAEPDRTRDLRSRLRRAGISSPISVYGYPACPNVDGDEYRRLSSERLRGRFFESLRGDAFLQPSHFESGSHHATGVAWRTTGATPMATIAYDLIPLIYPDHYLPEGHIGTERYLAQCETFKQYDLYLSISEATSRDLVTHLDIPPERIVNIGAGLDPGILAAARRHIDEGVELPFNEPFILMVGNGDWRKNSIGAVEAFASLPRSLQKQYKLVMTQAGHDVREALAGRFSSIQDRVHVLGNVDDATLAALYRRCAVFFFPSLYEGFGLPVIEAMAFGAPVISSNGGSLPEVVLSPRSLFDPLDKEETVATLEAALVDSDFRAVLSEGAAEHAASFSWDACATRALAALGTLDTGRYPKPAPAKPDQVLVSGRDIGVWGAMLAQDPTAENDVRLALDAIAARGARRILVDISEVVKLDARTGIQRVVRNYCVGLHALSASNGCRVEPVAWMDGRMHHARSYARTQLGMDIEGADEPVVAQLNDLLFMLDSSWIEPERFDALNAEVWKAGGEVVWMVYDLIPLLVPGTCDPGMPGAFNAWLSHAADHADGFICISEATRQDLEAFIDRRPKRRNRPWTRSMHLGSDLDGAAVSALAPGAQVKDVLAKIGTAPVYVAVGTVEPRKDHSTILAAFEAVWAEGSPAILLVVGKVGWNVEALAERMRNHAESGNRLFWFEKAGDADLAALMARSNGLIQASIAEGFGLPIIEAGSLGMPLLLSDLPVFREIAGDEAVYFPVGDSSALADLIRSTAAGNWIRPHGIRTLTWEQSSQGVLEKLLA